MRNIVRKYGSRVALVGSGLLAASQAAFAEIPAAFTTAVTDMTEDGAGMGAALVGVAAAVGVALLAVSYVKKIRGAAK
jgi:hypothetical protein